MIKNAKKNCFRLHEIVNITIKTDSSLTNINISYYLNLRKPIVHREGFKILSHIQNVLKVFVLIEKILFILHVANG